MYAAYIHCLDFLKKVQHVELFEILSTRLSLFLSRHQQKLLIITNVLCLLCNYVTTTKISTDIGQNFLQLIFVVVFKKIHIILKLFGSAIGFSKILLKRL